MQDPRTSLTTGVAIGAAVVSLVLAPACAWRTSRRQTDIMEKTGAVSVSAPVLRARVNDLAERLSGRVEEATDRIRAESRDPVVRRLALNAKIEAVPTVHSAAYRADPLEGAVDLWALTFQLVQYTEKGLGLAAFGTQQPIAIDAAQGALADADALIQGVAVSPQAFARARAQVEQWAANNPIEHHFTARPSMAGRVAELRSEPDAFVSVGAVSDTLDSLSERLNVYAAQLPKQARWQAQLMLEEVSGEPDLVATLNDVHSLGAAARSANAALEDVPGLLGAARLPVTEMLAAERRAALAEVDRQCRETLALVTAERLAVLGAADEERTAVVAALRQERIDGLKEVDAIKSRAVETARLTLGSRTGTAS